MAALSAFHSQSFLQTFSFKLNLSTRKKGFPFKSGCRFVFNPHLQIKS